MTENYKWPYLANPILRPPDVGAFPRLRKRRRPTATSPQSRDSTNFSARTGYSHLLRYTPCLYRSITAADRITLRCVHAFIVPLLTESAHPVELGRSSRVSNAFLSRRTAVGSDNLHLSRPLPVPFRSNLLHNESGDFKSASKRPSVGALSGSLSMILYMLSKTDCCFTERDEGLSRTSAIP